MAIIDVVSWNAMPGVFAWKYPSQELSTWTQLIVRESQEATLFKDGQAVGPFEAGRHTLSTENYPVLNSLLKIPFGRSPFFAEVWFVQKAFCLNIRWGTSSPIQIEDPQYHIMLPVRAFGQYGITVENTSKFLIKLVGTLPAFTEKTLSDFFRGIIVTECKDLIAKYLVEKKVSILKISANLVEISNFLSERFTEVLSDFGLKLSNFTVNSISTNEDDPIVKQLKTALAKKAEMNILGYNYQQERSFDTMEKAAGNNGNSMLGAGMGMGMGTGIGFGFGNVMGNMANMVSHNISQPEITCPKCGAKNSQEARFCCSCATELYHNDKKETKCCGCGQIVFSNMKFCSNCGRTLLLCPECGSDNPAGTQICINCGKALPIECPKCGKTVSGNVKFCPECGQVLKTVCSRCGTVLSNGTKFCRECGQKL